MKPTREILDAVARAEREGRVTDTTKRRKRTPKALGSGWSVTLLLPCRVVSEMNRREHWAVRHKRFQEHKSAVFSVWENCPLPMHRNGWNYAFPLTVTLTHIGHRLDDDNLNGAMKAVRDEIARLIGIDDGDERISWAYDQRPGPGGVEVRIEPRG